MRLLTLLVFFLAAVSAKAMVVSGNGLCPEEFEGRVKEVIGEVGPETAFSKQKVLFSNEETIKGVVGDLVSVDVLKNGPFQIEVGKDYRVLLRKGKLCWIEEI